MWRDLEDENVARNNKERLTVGGRQERTDIFNDNISCTSLTESHGNESMGDFADLGENYFDTQAWSGLSSSNENEVGDSSIYERERPRLIFQERENNCERGHASSTPRINKSPRAQWPGENERENEHERVRVIRGSGQLKSQRRESCSGNAHNQTAETGAQIETVPDGLIINHIEERTNHMQRRIHRLCGRQALIDMLAKADMERQRELQGLLECRVVSQFPHRNRIQSLLKSRFLRNLRVVEEPRPKSRAASELGLLMQRQTVSGLREGFITRLDKGVNGESSNQIDTESDGISNSIINEESQGSSSHGISDEPYEQCDNTNKKRSSDLVDDLEVHTVERRNGEDLSGHEEALDTHERDDCIASMNLAAVSVDGNRERSHSVESTQDIPENEVLENNQLQEPREVGHGTMDSRSEENNFHTLSVNDSRSQDNNIHAVSELWDDSESSTSASTYTEESSSQADHHELAAHDVDDDIDLKQNTTTGLSMYNDVGEETNTNWQGNTDNGSSRDMLDEERSQLEHLPDMNEDSDDSEGSAEEWVDRSYHLEAIPVPRGVSFYPHDDDNAHNVELRDLLSRRRVSNLLQSGFRESLNRLLQSYADRQSNTPVGLGYRQ